MAEHFCEVPSPIQRTPGFFRRAAQPPGPTSKALGRIVRYLRRPVGRIGHMAETTGGAVEALGCIPFTSDRTLNPQQ